MLYPLGLPLQGCSWTPWNRVSWPALTYLELVVCSKGRRGRCFPLGPSRHIPVAQHRAWASPNGTVASCAVAMSSGQPWQNARRGSRGQASALPKVAKRGLHGCYFYLLCRGSPLALAAPALNPNGQQVVLRIITSLLVPARRNDSSIRGFANHFLGFTCFLLLIPSHPMFGRDRAAEIRLCAIAKPARSPSVDRWPGST